MSFQISLSEFALCLYDAIDNLKKADPEYKYSSDGSIHAVMTFRRHVISHRARNWGSPESNFTIEMLKNNPKKIFEDSHQAAIEFVNELKKRGLPLSAGENWPAIPSFRSADLQILESSLSDQTSYLAIPNEEDLETFFGRSK